MRISIYSKRHDESSIQIFPQKSVNFINSGIYNHLREFFTLVYNFPY